MVRRQVEQGEVEFVFLDIAALIDVEAHISPDRLELTVGAGGRMQATAAALGRAGKRDVDVAFFEVVRQHLALL